MAGSCGHVRHLGVQLNSREFFGLAEELSESQEGLCSIESEHICVFAMKNIKRPLFLLKSGCVFCEAEQNCTTEKCTDYCEENMC